MEESEWYRLLPPELMKAAYNAKGELAWPTQQALQVVDVLDANGCIASRVEVWLPTNPGPTIPAPYFYSWRIKSSSQKEDRPGSAREFIESFAWDPADKNKMGLTPVFNISARRKVN